MYQGSYLEGFITKCAQAQADPQALLQKYLQAVPPDPSRQRKRYEQMITAGNIGVTDIMANSVKDLNPKKLQAIYDWVNKNPKAPARVLRFSQGPSPYDKTKILGIQKHPVYAAAFPKVQKGFKDAMLDYLKQNPDFVNLVQPKQTSAPAPQKAVPTEPMQVKK